MTSIRNHKRFRVRGYIQPATHPHVCGIRGLIDNINNRIQTKQKTKKNRQQREYSFIPNCMRVERKRALYSHAWRLIVEKFFFNVTRSIRGH